MTLTRERSEQLLAIQKTPMPNPPPAWVEARAPDGTVFSMTLPNFAVHAAGVTENLKVEGRWRGEDDSQIFLYVVDGRRQVSIARLCNSRHHAGDLHWHYHEGARGAEERVPLSHPPGNMSPQTLLDEVFLPGLHITRQTGLGI